MPAALALLAAASLELAVLTAPPCEIHHPAGLAPEARDVAAALPAAAARLARELESPPLPPCTIYLTTGGTAGVVPAAAAMPDWAAGIAIPSSRAMVLRVDRIGTWRQRHLLGVLAHETAHLLMHEAAGGPGGADRMPGWFREGTAATLARDGELMDFVNLWISPLPSAGRPLALVDAWLRDGPTPARTRAAYAGAFSFMRFAIRRHGPRLPARVLAGLRGGAGFETAWSAAAGVTLAAEEEAWAASLRGKTRWAAILTSTAALWMTITGMFLFAWLLKRRRAARVLQRWEEVEADEPYE